MKDLNLKDIWDSIILVNKRCHGISFPEKINSELGTVMKFLLKRKVEI